MFYLISLVPLLIFMCFEITAFSVLAKDENHELKERGAKPDRLVPLELLEHLQNANTNSAEQQAPDNAPFLIPTAKACGDIQRPSYAKATCTTYPGRIVCQLGRYTFVINNGDHKMNPEIIERFAAMIYHRSQEGDSDFDVSVDVPVKINEEFFVPPQKFYVTTTPRPEELRYPVFVECTPIRDERKMCNPPYSPSEITYSCKRRELGFGGYGGGGHQKRMVISVDREGTVSAGDLVLPYNALIDRRMKRQKDKLPADAGLVRLTPSGTDNKLYGDECSYQTKGWCPQAVGTECPPSCRTEKEQTYNDCAVNGATPANGVEGAQAAEGHPSAQGPRALPGGNSINPVIQPKQNYQGANLVNLPQEKDIIPPMMDDNAELYALTKIPPLAVRVYTDICPLVTEFPWCPNSLGNIIDCSIPTCVTVDDCTTTACRQRREWKKEKKAAWQGSRHFQNRMRNMRRLGQKRAIMKKRKRQVYKLAGVSNFHFQMLSSGLWNLTSTTRFSPFGKYSISGRTPLSTKSPTTAKPAKPATFILECSPISTEAFETECVPNTPECITTQQCIIVTECVTPTTECVTPSTECLPVTESSETTTECIPIFGFKRMPLIKREMRRRRKNPIHLQRPYMSRERYILE